MTAGPDEAAAKSESWVVGSAASNVWATAA
jgi:hypothetical protein